MGGHRHSRKWQECWQEREAGNSHLEPHAISKVEAEWVLNLLKSVLRKTTPPEPPQTGPAAVDTMFKCQRQWGPFSFKLSLSTLQQGQIQDLCLQKTEGKAAEKERKEAGEKGGRGDVGVWEVCAWSKIGLGEVLFLGNALFYWYFLFIL